MYGTLYGWAIHKNKRKPSILFSGGTHKIKKKYKEDGAVGSNIVTCCLYYSGTIESTGQTTQARSSYLPSEVLWGHRFQPMVVYNKERQGYEVDYSRFNNTDLVDTPLCSAKQLEQFYQMQQELGQPIPLDRGS